MLITVLVPLLSLTAAHADDLTVAQAVAAGLPAELPLTLRGSEDCACVVLDYGAQGAVRLTADQVTGLQRVTGKDPALSATVAHADGPQRFRLAGGLCERVALLSMSVAQWLKEELAVVDASGRPSSPGCNSVPASP
jgi:hypothetical protein